MSSKNSELEEALFNISELISINSELLNSPAINTVKELSFSLPTLEYPTSFANSVSAMVANFSDITRINPGITVACKEVARNLSLINHSTANIRKAIMVSDRLSDILKNSTDVFNSFPEPQEDVDVDDYVVIPEKSVKEINIPDTIAIPIGNSRIRISTANFIALIGLIITIFMFVSDRIESEQSTRASAAFYAEQNRLAKERNQYLQELLESADYSNSSLREDSEDARSAFQESGVSPDSAQSLTDNTTESSNTASEN